MTKSTITFRPSNDLRQRLERLMEAMSRYAGYRRNRSAVLKAVLSGETSLAQLETQYLKKRKTA